MHVLVNAAATDAGAVTDLTVEAWDRVLAINLLAVFALSRLVIPDMTEAGQGTIVNISSVAGRRGWANASAYCASKLALTGFTQALGAEVRQHGIRACVISPGAMATHWGTFAAQDRPAGEPLPSSSPAPGARPSPRQPTVSVPCIPAARCPGTLQKNVYVPALRFAVRVLVPPWNVGVAPTTGPLVTC